MMMGRLAIAFNTWEQKENEKNEFRPFKFTDKKSYINWLRENGLFVGEGCYPCCYKETHHSSAGRCTASHGLICDAEKPKFMAILKKYGGMPV